MFPLKAAPAPASPAVEAPPQLAAMNPPRSWRLSVQGFSPSERQLLQGLVALSRRRLPQLELVSDDEACSAEVVLIDAKNPASVRWAQSQAWLAGTAAVWVDTDTAPAGHLCVRRPVPWPTIAVLLARALEQHGQCGR